jgi:hypothetical protein
VCILSRAEEIRNNDLTDIEVNLNARLMFFSDFGRLSWRK